MWKQPQVQRRSLHHCECIPTDCNQSQSWILYAAWFPRTIQERLMSNRPSVSKHAHAPTARSAMTSSLLLSSMPCVHTQVIWMDAADTVASSTASASSARPMLHPPKPSAPATLPPNKGATPAPTTINVNKTVHPNAVDTSAHAAATANLPADDVPSDAAMSVAAAAASSEQPESIPSSDPQSNLVGADHTAGPFAATTVDSSANAAGRDNVPQGKDLPQLGVIGVVSGKLSDAPGLLSGVPVLAAPLQRALVSSTHGASTTVELPVNASWQGRARLDQAAGSQQGKTNAGELAAQTGPMSPGGSPASVVQGKKRKVPEATGGLLITCVMFVHACKTAGCMLFLWFFAVSSFWKPFCHIKTFDCTVFLCFSAVSLLQKPICHVYTPKTVGCLPLLSFSALPTI